MNDMESRKFEDAFRDAFKEAEVSPTENVWTNIELDLEKAEGDKMKRRIFFYKLLAAASIAFAMSVAGVGYYILQDQQRFDGSLAVNPKTESSSERNAQTRTGETAGQQQATEGNTSGNTTADQTISSNDAVTNGKENAANENSQASTSSSAILKDNKAADNNATDNSIASLNTRDENASSNAKKNNLNKQRTTATSSDNQSSSAARQSETNAVSSDKSNAEKVYNASDKTNKNAIAKTEQKNANTSKQNSAAEDAAQTSIASADGKQGNALHNAQATASTEQSTGKNTKGVNDIANTSSQQQVASNDAGKNNSGLNQQDQNSGIAEKQNTIASAEQKRNANETNDKTIQNTNSASQTVNSQGIAANDTSSPSNNASALTNDQKQSVAATDNKNAVDINPFSRYYTANHGEFGAVNNSSTLASNEGVKKLPSRVDKPADFDATKLAPQVDPLMLMLAKLDEEGKGRSEEKKEGDNTGSEKLWTSVGFAAGSFNTVNSTVSQSQSQSFAMNNVATQQAKASGSSYTVGLSMGTRLSKRWVVQGGVNYMTQSSDYTSNAVGASADFANFSAPAVNSMMSEADNRIVSTAPYTINSSLQFVSIPLQAGYMIVNKRFGVQLNGGVSTDMFLQNTLTPESDNVSKTTQGSGSDSPYRTFNFSGLVGTEFSYKFGQHYRLALNPGIRYPFSSIYKSDQPITAMPLTFDVGLRFRYIFH
jgi:hypothetical protein